jgi:hypothetical protein
MKSIQSLASTELKNLKALSLSILTQLSLKSTNVMRRLIPTSPTEFKVKKMMQSMSFWAVTLLMMPNSGLITTNS